ncbi:MAG TPA: S41 family peptidase [Taishania sp.]|nr:S41 family peptidase [Taishania sp.]HNS41160.1 S41 family peptidase [Taishania sp.]
MKNNTIQSFALSAIAVFIISIQFSWAQSERFEIIKNMELIDEIYENLDKYYVESPKIGKMSVAGISAMLEDLDPYTVFYPESDIEDYRLMTTGQYGGIGAIIRKIGDYVVIAEPYEGSPAATAGIRAGDKILAIDGRSMQKKNTDEVSSNLKGPKGTTITVEVERPNGAKETVKITRDEIKVPDIPYAGMLNNEVGYIKLTSFTQTASSEVKKNFLSLKEKGMKKLVFDLRGNGGGLLMEAVHIVNMFVPKGQLVVQTKGRLVEENREYKTVNEPLDLNIPVVVLVDGGSASASEIVSGSLQDLDRAVVVGETSFGKGLVQRTLDLSYGAKMKLTIAKYYTPSGRCVQRLEYYDRNEGAKPEDVPDSLLHVFKTKNGRDVIDGRGIEPDMKVEAPELSRLALMIYANNVLFNYVTDYVKTHPSIAPAEQFRLSDEDYEAFKKYAIQDTFTYSTASEEQLMKMQKTIEKENLMDDAKAEYEALMAKITPSKERDLVKFEAQIRQLIENEIVSRYYFQQGRVQNSFNHDEVLKKGIEVLNNTQQYNTILKK